MNPPKIVNRYVYPLLEQVTLESGVRHYVTPEQDKLPSVTTILSATADKEWLKKWEEWVGEAAADKARKEGTDLGSLLHQNLEDFVGGVERKNKTNMIHRMARMMADTIIERGLKNVDEVWGMEKALYVPGLYAGTADLTGVHLREDAIMDYKNAKKMRKKSEIQDYSCQLGAYAIAHDELYGTKIKKGVVFMCARDLQFNEYIWEGLELERAKEEWLRRVDIFYEMKASGEIN